MKEEEGKEGEERGRERKPGGGRVMKASERRKTRHDGKEEIKKERRGEGKGDAEVMREGDA